MRRPIWHAFQVELSRLCDPEDAVPDQPFAAAPIFVHPAAELRLDVKALGLRIRAEIARPPEGGFFGQRLPNARGRRGDFDFQFDFSMVEATVSMGTFCGAVKCRRTAAPSCRPAARLHWRIDAVRIPNAAQRVRFSAKPVGARPAETGPARSCFE